VRMHNLHKIDTTKLVHIIFWRLVSTIDRGAYCTSIHMSNVSVPWMPIQSCVWRVFILGLSLFTLDPVVEKVPNLVNSRTIEEIIASFIIMSIVSRKSSACNIFE
jgi:hypothetical protein